MKINCPILFSAFFVLAFLSSVRPSLCSEADDMSWVLGMDENLENSGTLEGIVSADSVKVTGCVTDADGMAVEYVSVEIISVADTMSVAIGTFEEGRFIFNDIQPGKYRLNIYFMGYKPKSVTFETTGTNTDLGTIILEKDIETLETATVTGVKQLYKKQQSKLIVNIEGTSLSQAATLRDILRRSPGLTISAGGGIEVFGKGRPIIYIDGREMMSSAELEVLRPQDIERIEIDRNPSAKYSASGRAVLQIRTKKKKYDDISISVFDYAKHGRRFGNTAGFQLTHKHRGLSNILSYSFTHEGSKAYESSILERDLQDGKFNNTSNSVLEGFADAHTVFSGNEYKFNDRHTVGLQFSGAWTDMDIDVVSEQKISQSGKNDIFKQNSQPMNMGSRFYNTNIYYEVIPDADRQSRLTIIAGYAYSKSFSCSDLTETDLGSGHEKVSEIGSRGNYNVFSAKADYRVKFDKFPNVSAGLKYSRVLNKGISDRTDAVTGESYYSQNNDIDDFVGAAYVNFDKRLGNFYLSAGIRYEYTVSDAYADGTDFNTDYHGFFPSFTFNWSKKHWDISLNYARRISRPSFNMLNPNLIYSDSLYYRCGNPLLKPTFSNDIEFSLYWNGFDFTAGYTHYEDYVASIMESDPVNPTVTRYTYTNFDNYQEWLFGLGYHGQWNWYTGSYEVYLNVPYGKIDYMGKPLLRNRPSVKVSLHNTFDVSDNVSLYCDFYYSSGKEEDITIFKPSYDLSAGMVWYLLDNKLAISLDVYDILYMSNTSCYQMRYGNTTVNVDNREDTRYVRLGIRYSFNNIKANIRIRQSNSEEIGRVM